MADPKGFLKVTERELAPRRPVPVRIMDWKEVYEPGDTAVLRRQAGLGAHPARGGEVLRRVAALLAGHRTLAPGHDQGSNLA